MKEVEKISDNKNYTAVNVGSLNDIKSYSLIHPKSGKEIKGKVFLKALVNLQKSRETYIILKGAGYYQVDEDYFPVKEGSVIRVAPEGVRSLCNTSEVDMVYICIQAKENSLEEYTTDDGKRIDYTPKWKL